MVLCLGIAAMPARAGTVGVISEASGDVRLLRGENYFEALRGVEVEPQDILETGRDASLQLDMEDGSVFRLGPGSRLALSEYRLAEDKSILSAGVDLLTGWLRFAVAKLHRADADFVINAPVLTVGIRGTEGVLEAANEQGGLHMQEGVVEVRGAGPGEAPLRVSGGEFVERERGRPFRRHARPPEAFARRLPPVVQHKLARRAQLLRARGVPPRHIRAITREDARRFLHTHPHLNQRLRERFQRFDGRPARPDGAQPLRPGAFQPGEGRTAEPGAAERPKMREDLREQRREAIREHRRVPGGDAPKGGGVAPGRPGGAPAEPKERPHLPPPGGAR
jgi:hypothetical protein